VTEEDISLEWQYQLDALDLADSETILLKELFDSLSQRSGRLDVKCLLKKLKYENNVFIAKVMGMLGDFVNFRDFVLIVWNYCTLSEKELVKLSFELYCEPQRVLSLEGLTSLVWDICGDDIAQFAAHDLIENVRCGQIDLPLRLFYSYFMLYAEVFSPIKVFQNSLCEFCFGCEVTCPAAARMRVTRAEICCGKYIPLPDLVTLLERDPFEEKPPLILTASQRRLQLLTHENSLCSSSDSRLSIENDVSISERSSTTDRIVPSARRALIMATREIYSRNCSDTSST